MKKIYSTQEYKRRNTSRSKRVQRISKRRKKKKTTTSFIYRAENKKLRPLINIESPKHFSLIDNCEETIEYFNKAQRNLKKKNNIQFDISQVTKLTTDAIAVKIAKIKDEKFNSAGMIYGNAPKDENLQKLFLQSGFYEYVSKTGYRPKNKAKLLIHKITDNRVEPEIAKRACILGLEHTFGNNEIFEPLYEILIEIMQNTNNHAGESRGVYDWWLHVYNHPNSNKTSYTFLDLGFGIFESLPVKSYKRSLLEKVGLASNVDLVSSLFAGDIKSRTAKPERGKGIPQVYQCSKDPTFEKFILISNDVYADLKNEKYSKLRTEFEGTMFYWEINN